MTSNDDLSIAELFDSAYDLQEQLQSNKIEEKLETYNLALDRLKLAEEKIDELHLFSDNEELSEVASNELRYFILYALIGWLYEYRVTTREQRADDVQSAIAYYIKYFELCRNYQLVKQIPKVHDDQNEGKLRLQATENRQLKIQKLKEKKAMEESISKLRAMTHADDETKRQLYVEQIKWWIQQAEEEIAALQDEATLIQFSREPRHNHTTAPAAKNTLPIDGPFTLTTAKDRLYREAIGGAGYPSLPTMTVEEFYDDLVARQAQQPVVAPRVAPPSDEHLNDTDDPTHRQTVRQTDEFKDDNPRGAGNRYNRS